MILTVREYHDIKSVNDVTFGTPYQEEYAITDAVLSHQLYDLTVLAHRAMFKAAKENGWDYVQFYDSDRMIFYHAFVENEGESEDD